MARAHLRLLGHIGEEIAFNMSLTASVTNPGLDPELRHQVGELGVALAGSRN